MGAEGRVPYWAYSAGRTDETPAGELLAELDHMAEARARRLERSETRRPDQVSDGPRDRLGDLVGLLLALAGVATAVAVILTAALVEVP